MTLETAHHESVPASAFLHDKTSLIRDKIIESELLKLQQSKNISPEALTGGRNGLESCRKFKTLADFETAIDEFDRNHIGSVSTFFSKKSFSADAFAIEKVRTVYDAVKYFLGYQNELQPEAQANARHVIVDAIDHKHSLQ